MKKYSSKLCRDKTVETIADFEDLCDLCLDAIEDKINGIGDYSNMRIVTANRFIKDVCIAARDIFNYSGIFKIYIDEYETLLVYQQRIVNTLIKHSELPVVFNVGMKPHGMHTPKTISETESIEEPHDYISVDLTLEDPEGYFSLLEKISSKRIEWGKNQGKIPSDAPEKIQFYLGMYSVDEEISRIEKSKNLTIKSELKKLIQDRCHEERVSDELTQEYVRVLCDEADILQSRIHYALIKKRTQYSQKISDVYEAKKNNTRVYNDWFHNRKNGAIFLLCKETKRKKMYFGFDAYARLSSNNVRSFLELCEQAFRFSFLEGFQWDSKIPEDIQTEAAYYVSDKKIKEIATYKYGRDFLIFTKYLGGIFNSLHTEKDSTLGEPEPNHFSTEDLSIEDDAERKIKMALLYNVLQEDEPTKKKNREDSSETVDYYLNKIYAPHFGISYRDMRKIHLPHELLELLLTGNEKDAIKARNQFFSKQKIEDFNPGQISILDLTSEE